MTRYETLLCEALRDEVTGLDTETAARLVTAGLVNRTACERIAVRREVARMAREGIPRCEALILAAQTLCCSYEKARGLFYGK